MTWRHVTEVLVIMVAFVGAMTIVRWARSVLVSAVVSFRSRPRKADRLTEIDQRLDRLESSIFALSEVITREVIPLLGIVGGDDAGEPSEVTEILEPLASRA